jgi:mono/diheme cytochrome c family protein/YHS domain-containing protein
MARLSPLLLALLAGCERPAGESSYARKIAPILAERCAGCHGAEKQKGKLALDRPEAISKGGADGVVIVPGQPQESELVRRVKLPLDDEDHMPPKDRPQPSAEEIAAIEEWVAAGASFAGGAATAPKAAAAASTPAAKVPPADSKAVAALEAALVHVEKADPQAELLWLDFAAGAPSWTDEKLEQALAPLAAEVADLSLARTHAGALTLALTRRMPRLERLDLRATGVDDGALANLAGHARIRQLVLVKAKLSDASVATLIALPALKRVYLWQSGITPAGSASLASQRPDLVIDTGDATAAAPLEVEPELKLTSEAPVPGADAKPVSAAGAALEPVNTVCPVSGSPVDARHTVVFEGRVIGFCCDKCPAKFLAEPEKFRSKLPKAP